MLDLHKQKGMTAIGWMFVLGLIAFFVLLIMRLLPLYMEYSKVSTVMDTVANETNISGKTKSAIIGMVSKQFDVNDIRNVDPKKIQIKKEDGVLKAGIAYERRVHLFGNIDLVASFDKEVRAVGR